MDESTADAILDWIDADNEPRDQGAEADYYLGLDPPVRPRNAVPPSLDELLLVRGVTREKLFGLDRNANFDVDAWEAELDLPSPPGSTATAHRQAASADPLVPLLDRVQRRTGREFRGPASAFCSISRTWVRCTASCRRCWSRVGPTSSSLIDNTVRIREVKRARMRRRWSVDLSQAAAAQHPVAAGTDGGARGDSHRRARIRKQIFASPLTDDPGQMREYLPKLMDQVTVRSGTPIVGRVNINLAEREVLAAYPRIRHVRSPSASSPRAHWSPWTTPLDVMPCGC